MFSLTIETDNAAFEDDPIYEVGRILAELAHRLDSDGNRTPAGSLRDRNGNTVGRWELELEPDDEPEQRLEYLRGELRAERISYGELAELQSLAEHIDAGDVELLEAAGVPEHDEPDEDPRALESDEPPAGSFPGEAGYDEPAPELAAEVADALGSAAYVNLAALRQASPGELRGIIDAGGPSALIDAARKELGRRP